MPRKPKARETHPERQVYVGGLDRTVTEEDLLPIFSKAGPVKYIHLAKKRHSYAFVHYETEAEARAARLFNGELVKGVTLVVSLLGHERNPDANVFVKNLPEAWTVVEVEQLFSRFGEVATSKVNRDSEGKSLRYGYVLFKQPEHADNAISELNNYEVEGAKLLVSKFISTNDLQSNYKSRNLYVRGFNPEVTEVDLQNRFKEFGAVAAVLILSPTEEPKRTDRVALVSFQTEESAQAAIDALHGKVEGETAWHVDHYKFQHERSEEANKEYLLKQDEWKKRNVLIKNLALEVTEEQLSELVRPFGTIESLKLQGNEPEAQNSSPPRAYRGGRLGRGGFRRPRVVRRRPKVDRDTKVAYACFEKQEDAERAVAELNGKELGGKQIGVVIWLPFHEFRNKAAAARAEPERAIEESRSRSRSHSPPAAAGDSS
mmetsp:Transcript_32832/g.57373  ORF Transcript_32832/g.57373 Transcript_32832/m.57373 type:complete len:431 (-) Transcript_32832:212-1504(-)